MSQIDWQDTLKRIDLLIRTGRGESARRELRRLMRVKVPRPLCAAVAALARRGGFHSYALRLLNPIVRPTGKLAMVATEGERAEYAASLTYVGAGEEAMGILKMIDAKTIPEVLLFETYALFSQWDYARGIPLLNRFLDCGNVPDYLRLVGKINLLAALVHERQHGQADPIFQSVFVETRQMGHYLLYANALEIASQHYIFQKKWEDAGKCLTSAAELLRHMEILDAFYVTKWRTILDFLRASPKARNFGELRRVRADASFRRHWETVRDCDRFEALTTKDEKLLIHLYFGTPYDSFRRRLLLDLGADVSIPEQYVWRLSRTSKPSHILDLAFGESLKGSAKLKMGQLLHRLLVVLAMDFYRPARVASAYFHLYPGEYYNPITSPHRVHEAVRRLKTWFRRKRIPLTVIEHSGCYHLEAIGPCAIRIRHGGPLPDRCGLLMEKIRARWAAKFFSAKDVGKFLRISKRSAVRALNECQQRGGMQRTGRGPKTRYFFSPH